METTKFRRWAHILGWMDPIYHGLYLLYALSITSYLSYQINRPFNEFKELFAKKEQAFLSLVHLLQFKGSHTPYTVNEGMQQIIYFRNSYAVDVVVTLIHILLGILLLMSTWAKKRKSVSLKLVSAWMIGNLVLLLVYSIWRFWDEFWITLVLGIALRVAPVFFVGCFINQLRKSSVEEMMNAGTNKLKPLPPLMSKKRVSGPVPPVEQVVPTVTKAEMPFTEDL